MKKIVSVVALVMVMAFTPAMATAEEAITFNGEDFEVKQDYREIDNHKIMIINEDYSITPGPNGMEWVMVDMDIIDRSKFHVNTMNIDCFQYDSDYEVLEYNSFSVKADFDYMMQNVAKIVGPKEDGIYGVVCYVNSYTLGDE